MALGGEGSGELAFLGPGDSFGEGFVLHIRSRDTLICEKSVIALFASSEDIMNLCEDKYRDQLQVYLSATRRRMEIFCRRSACKPKPQILDKMPSIKSKGDRRRSKFSEFVDIFGEENNKHGAVILSTEATPIAEENEVQKEVKFENSEESESGSDQNDQLIQDKINKNVARQRHSLLKNNNRNQSRSEECSDISEHVANNDNRNDLRKVSHGQPQSKLSNNIGSQVYDFHKQSSIKSLKQDNLMLGSQAHSFHNPPGDNDLPKSDEDEISSTEFVNNKALLLLEGLEDLKCSPTVPQISLFNNPRGIPRNKVDKPRRFKVSRSIKTLGTLPSPSRNKYMTGEISDDDDGEAHDLHVHEMHNKIDYNQMLSSLNQISSPVLHFDPTHPQSSLHHNSNTQCAQATFLQFAQCRAKRARRQLDDSDGEDESFDEISPIANFRQADLWDCENNNIILKNLEVAV